MDTLSVYSIESILRFNLYFLKSINLKKEEFVGNQFWFS